MNESLRSKLNRVQLGAVVTGLLAIVASAVGAFFDLRQFFFSYLFAVLFWLGLSLGCLVVTMIHQLTGGRWGYPTRRFLEAGFMVLPLMLVLFIPVLFGLKHLYPWAQPSELAADPVLQHRQAYLNQSAFIIRALVFFVATIWMAWSL